MPSVKSFFNPFSSEHHATTYFGGNFGKFSAGKKILTIFLFLVGLLGFGVGAVAVFRKLTYTFSQKKPEDTQTIEKTDKIGSGIISKKELRNLEKLSEKERGNILENKNFNLNEKAFKGGSTFLHVICAKESLDVIAELVTRENADFEIKNSKNWTPEVILNWRINNSKNLIQEKKTQATLIQQKIILKTKNSEKITQEILKSNDIEFLDKLLDKHKELTKEEYELKCDSQDPEIIYALVKRTDDNKVIKDTIRFFKKDLKDSSEKKELEEIAKTFIEAISDEEKFPEKDRVIEKVKKAFEINN